ncbi:hypothetical protein RF11_04229 [Thelohanellus kitauei]|uniref:Uncharacterized protein n=1 Tax=Thelohanellus kitauei TaxID=669202 RepID=A0A0C2IUR9_THEKT|nr:hypothetical protein RF11_04229 [Thelohanellus kitauei]
MPFLFLRSTISRHEQKLISLNDPIVYRTSYGILPSSAEPKQLKPVTTRLKFQTNPLHPPQRLRSLDNCNGIHTCFLVEIRSKAIDVYQHMGHLHFLSNKGSEMRRERGRL